MSTLVVAFDESDVKDEANIDKDTNVSVSSGMGLKDSMKPIMWCLKLTGLLHSIPLKGPCQRKNLMAMLSKVCYSPGLLYAIFVVLLLWCNVGLSLMPFQNVTTFDGAACNQIITSTWFLQVACTALANTILCRRWRKIFPAWDKNVNTLDPRLQIGIRRSAIVAVVFYVVWLFAEFGFVGLGAYLLGGGGLAAGGSLTDNKAFNGFFQFLFILIFFYFVSTWYLMTAAFSILAVGLFRAFQRFQKRLEENFVDGKFKGDIEQLRQKHGGLVRLLGTIDDMFSVYIMMIVGTIIPLIIFTLYFVLFETIDMFSYVATWWSISLSVFQIMVVFFGGGIVNHMVSLSDGCGIH